MKALSVQPYWATSILQKTKTVECRTWKTDYRGDLLICASSGPWWAGSIRKRAGNVQFLAHFDSGIASR